MVGGSAPPEARRELLLALDLQEDLAVHEQEAGGRVEDLDEPSAFPQGDRFLTGQELGGPLSLELLGVEAADDRQAVRPNTLHRLGLEGDVGVDPISFSQAVGDRFGRKPVVRDVDLARSRRDGGRYSFEPPVAATSTRNAARCGGLLAPESRTASCSSVSASKPEPSVIYRF